MEAPKLNEALITLIVFAHHVLVGDALATPEGREELKTIFCQALAAVPSLESTPEFGRAMLLITLADNVQRRSDLGEAIDPAELEAIVASGLAPLPVDPSEVQ